MPQFKTACLTLLSGLALVLISVTAATAEIKFSAQEPVLLTSAGQSADVNMVKVLLERAKIALNMSPLAGPDDLKDARSLIVVIGGSTKGLGAAGINVENELARVKRLLDRAAERKIPLLGLHIGGKARRGELSDKFIELVAPRASFLLVVKEGDDDGFFSKIIAARKIEALIVEKLAGLRQPLKTIYGK